MKSLPNSYIIKLDDLIINNYTIPVYNRDTIIIIDDFYLIEYFHEKYILLK